MREQFTAPALKELLLKDRVSSLFLVQVFIATALHLCSSILQEI